jgi:hypothetical protein
MKKHIAEELPTRKHPAAVVDKKDDDRKEEGGESSEKRTRQAVYDIRYRARREDIDLKQAFSQYMQNSSMAANERTLVKQKLFGKSLGEEYGMSNAAAGTLAKAMYKVFVEGISYENNLAALYEEEIKATPDTKYKVKVTDKNSGRSYVRFATREKINQLRLNPNISDVSLLDPRDTREPYEGERSKGASTAAVKSGKGLGGDTKKPNDGNLANNYPPYDKVTRGDVVAGRLGKDQMGGKRKVKEEFVGEVVDTEDDKKSKKIDIMKKGKKNNIKVFPTDGEATRHTGGVLRASYESSGTILSEKSVSKSQARFMRMVYATKKGEPAPSSEVASAAKTITKKEAKKFATTPDSGLPEKVNTKEETKVEFKDTRDLPTKINLIKNKMRAMGSKNPIVMVASEENVEEAAPLVIGAGLAAAAAAPYLLKKFAKPAVDKAIDKPATGSGGLVDKIKQRRDAMNQMNSYELDGELVDEERGRRGPDRNALGGADRDNSRRYRYLGSATPEQEREEKERANAAAEAARKRLRANLAKEEERKNRGR